MKYVVSGVDARTGEEREPLEVDAPTKEAAAREARNHGLLATRVKAAPEQPRHSSKPFEPYEPPEDPPDCGAHDVPVLVGVFGGLVCVLGVVIAIQVFAVGACVIFAGLLIVIWSTLLYISALLRNLLLQRHDEVRSSSAPSSGSGEPARGPEADVAGS